MPFCLLSVKILTHVEFKLQYCVIMYKVFFYLFEIRLDTHF